MAIHINVLAELDRRHLEDSARDLVEMVGSAGEDAAKAFGHGLGAIADHSKTAQDALRGLNDAQANAALSAERLALAQMRYTQAAVNTNATATQLASAHLAVSAAQLSHERAAQSLTDAQHRLNETHQSAVGYLAAHSMSLEQWALAAGGAAAAAGSLVFALSHVGETFEEINRGLELTNSSTGEAMEGLKSHADALVASVDTASNQIGSDMGVLSSRLSMEPGAALDQLTEHVGMLRDRFGQLNTPVLTAGFREFHVQASQADAALASLTQSAIAAGVNVGTVVQGLAADGLTLAEAGLNYQQAAAFIAQATNDIGEGGASKAVSGLEFAMKDAAKHGMDLSTYIRSVYDSAMYFESLGTPAGLEKAQALMDQAFGPRRWAEAKALAEDFLGTFGKSADALKAPAGYMDDLEHKTRNLDNVFHQVRNHIEDALAPPGENAVDFIADKAKEFTDWIDAHRDDLRQLFTTGVDAAEHLLELIAKVAEFLAKYPGVIEGVVTAFAAWKTIEGVAALTKSLQTILGLLGVDIVGAAGSAGTAIGGFGAAAMAALGPVAAVLTTIAALEAVSIAKGSATGQESTQTPGVTYGPDGQVLSAGPMAPGKGPNFYKDWYGNMPAATPGASGGPAGPVFGPPLPEARGGTGGPGSPPSDLLFPDDPNKKKGPRLPQAPEVPYGPGYGAPPEIGETERHYAARQHLLEEQHALAEDQARLDQLEKTANANQDDIQKVKNKLLTDRGNIIKAEGDLYHTEEASLKRHGDALAEMGAKIDNDFGISKGLPGIAENLTKFLANLAFSPVFGALKGADAALGGPTHGAKGLAGIIGLATGMGSEGGAGSSGEPVWTGADWGGGPALPGLGGKLGAAPGIGGKGLAAAIANLAAGASASLGNAGGVPQPATPGAAGAAYTTPEGGLDAWISAAEAAAGVDASWTAGLKVLIGRESSGNPNAINLWDSNARAGHPSQGLMQTIPSTFNAFHVPGTSGSITDPVANIAAGIRYIQQRYGGIGGVQQANPNLPPKGYAEGGATPPSPLPQGAVPIIAHENEHVLTSADVNALGGQQAVYAMREQLHQGEGQPGGGPQAPRAGAPAPAVQAHPGGPQPGPSLIGGMSPSPGWGSGFQVTGSGLVGLAESLPSTAASAAAAGASFGAAFYGGAIEDIFPHYDGGGEVTPGGASGSPGGGGGPAGGSPGGSLISAAINIGMQELNEGISKGAQAVGAGVAGLQQTFGPEQFAQSKQAQTGWVSKLIGGFMGAHPQLPNTAGGKGGIPGLTPEQAASQHAAASGDSGTVNNNYGDPNHGVIINGDIHTTQPGNQFGEDLRKSYVAANDALMGRR